MDDYYRTTDQHPLRKLVLRFLLKVMWTRGAGPSPYPRATGADLRAALPNLEPGDIVLSGAAGNLSHVMVYVGDGQIIHSMATEKTGRGTWGSLRDALARPVNWVRGITEPTGVIDEPLADFFDRFVRDSWVVLRARDLGPEAIAAGIAHLRSLVGKPYDYDFSAGDDEYYCTEVVIEFLHTAGLTPDLHTRTVSIPLLIHTHIIEPISLLGCGDLAPVLANAAAHTAFGDELASARVAQST